MSLVLVRIDDRLIHGQVTVGWGSFLNPDRIILVSDEIAQNEWETELYKSSVPFNIAVSILTVYDAANTLNNKTYDSDRTILLVESPEIIVSLLDKGVQLRQVNIGGMHYKESRKKILPFLYVDEEDIKNFKIIKDHNIDLICQDLPQAKKENLVHLIKELG